jgi:hypothetical protein
LRRRLTPLSGGGAAPASGHDFLVVQESTPPTYGVRAASVS